MKIICGGAKSTVAKWNLIGRIQFKHMQKLPNVHVVQRLGMF